MRLCQVNRLIGGVAPGRTVRSGKSSPVTEDGKTYEEFYVFGMARPADLAAVEASLAQQMKGRLEHYFRHRGDNPIHWRKRLEWETVSGEAAVRYDDNGPDVEFRTNRKCVMDKNWLFITAYARLYCERGKTAVH